MSGASNADGGWTYRGRYRLPAGVTWTPLRQQCGCVIDWGWDSKTVAPPVFMQSCLQFVSVACPWHQSDGESLPTPPDEPVQLNFPEQGYSLFARAASGEDIALGERLAGELGKIADQLAREDWLSVLAEIPPKYRKWLYKKGKDPANVWIEQRLCDIVLNRGQVTLTPEMVDRLLD